MRVRLLRPGELGPAELAVWCAMQRSSPALADPFLSAEFAMAVGRHRPGTRVAVLSEGQEVAGFFAFEQRGLATAVPLCGWLSPCQGLVHAPGAVWDARYLLRACGLASWRFDNLIAEQPTFRPFHLSTGPAPVIDLSDGFDTYYAKLRARAPRFCRELARKGRKLARDAGPLRLISDSRDPALLRTLVAWKSEQYRRTAHVDRFGPPWVTGLLEELLAAGSEQLSGMLCVLYAGTEPVAAQFGLRAGGQAIGWFTGYNPRFRRYSPGLLQIVWMSRELAASGITALHMGKGAAGYTRELKSQDVWVADGIVTSRSVGGVFHLARASSARWAVGAVRRHPVLHDTADRALRLTGLSRRAYGRM